MLLFVTKGGEGCDKGFSYAIELAKTLNAGIAVLMISRRNISQTYEDIMAAVAFAEAGDMKTARELMKEDKEDEVKKIKVETEKIGKLTEMCLEASVGMTCDVVSGSVSDAIKDFLSAKSGIEMVLLSPSLSVEKDLKGIRELLKNISRPIVTITNPREAMA